MAEDNPRPEREQVSDQRERRKLEFLTKDVIKSRDYHELHNAYKFLRIILMGQTGSGKTRIARTAIKPVHIDSWDKGGTSTVQDLIDKGDIVADAQYEFETAQDPRMFSRWLVNMRERLDNGYFDYFGTYMLDSFTYWVKGVMNNVMKKRNAAGQVPVFNTDYPACREEMLLALDLLKRIPCDVIMTGHLEYTENEDKSSSQWHLVTIGRTESLVTGHFDEKWAARRVPVHGKMTYVVQTAPVEGYVTSTRIGREGVLNDFEPPDIKAIRKKAGWPVIDKPSLASIIGQ
jgi:hypothetical protein